MEVAAAVFSEERATALIQQKAEERGPLLEMLHALAEEFGYVDDRVIPLLADSLNISRAEVHGVLTFYRDFRRDPPAPLLLRICRAEACQAVGAEALVAHAQRKLSTELGKRSADGRIDLEQVFCLGNCALGPSVSFDGRLVGRVDENRLDALLEEPIGGAQ